MFRLARGERDADKADTPKDQRIYQTSPRKPGNGEGLEGGKLGIQNVARQIESG